MHSKEYHIQLGVEDVGKYAIMPGQAKRVEKIASFLEKSVYLGTNREYTSYAGYLEKERITVISSGIGGPSMAIAVEELYKIGIRTIIRVGSATTLQPYIKNGNLIIPTGIMRGAKTANEYLPSEYPAVPHHEVLYALIQSAQALKIQTHIGITHSKDAFFKEEPEKMPDSEGVKNYWKIVRKANVLCSEMETDTLFVLSSLRGIRSGAVFSAVGATEGISKEGIDGAIQTVIHAMKLLICQDRISSKKNFSEEDSPNF